MTAGIPWLGFVVYPSHIRLKSRKAVAATRRLRRRFAEFRGGAIELARLDASVKGWVNYAGHGSTWRLRQRVLDRAFWQSGRR